MKKIYFKTINLNFKTDSVFILNPIVQKIHDKILKFFYIIKNTKKMKIVFYTD